MDTTRAGNLGAHFHHFKSSVSRVEQNLLGFYETTHTYWQMFTVMAGIEVNLVTLM